MLLRVPSLRASFRIFVLALPLVILMAPKGTAPLLVAAALLAALAARREGRKVTWRALPVAVATGLLLGWAAVASSWSFAPGAAILLVLRLAALAMAGFWLLACAATLDTEERRDVTTWLLVGSAAALAVLLFELLFGHPLSHWLHDLGIGRAVTANMFNRATTFLAILAWPLTLGLWRTRVGGRHLGARALALPAGFMLLLLPLESLAAVVSLAAGLGFFALARVPGFPARAVLAVALVLGIAAAPLATTVIDREAVSEAAPLPGNALHRLYIWSFAGERILERPLLGWGFHASRYVPNREVAPYDNLGDRVILTHPHNAVLQVWLELGLVGAALLLALLLLLIERLGRLAPVERALSEATLVSVLIVACASFGLWQNHWFAILFIAPLALLLCRDGAGAG